MKLVRVSLQADLHDGLKKDPTVPRRWVPTLSTICYVALAVANAAAKADAIDAAQARSLALRGLNGRQHRLSE